MLLKEKKYKLLPILAFYTFTLVAVSLRIAYMVSFWVYSPIILNVDWV